MARPITWQDVAAPQVGASLAASQAAGQSITQALQGLAGVAQGEFDKRKTDATKQAVAGILSAEDPLAAAAAAPQNWAIDPLAVAQAAQAGDARVRANKASDASLAASQVSTQLGQAQLQDRVDQRDAALLSAPVIEAIRTKQPYSLDFKGDEWNTQGGLLAQERVLNFLDRQQDNDRANEALRLQRSQVKEAKAVNELRSFSRALGASTEGQALDPAEKDRRISAKAKELGVDFAVDDAATYFDRGVQANTATAEERSVPALSYEGGDGVTRSLSYDDVRSASIGRRRADNADQARAVLAEPVRKGGDTTWLQLQELGNGPSFQQDEKGTVDQKLADALKWDLDDAQDRINRIRAEYPKLTRAQAADIAFDTQDSWTDRGGAKDPRAKAKAAAWEEFDKMGGASGVMAGIQGKQAKFLKENSRLDTLDRQFTAATREGDFVPKAVVEILDGYRDDEKAKRAAAAAEEAAAKEKAAKAQAALKDATKYMGRPSYVLGQ
jgi:hypothetical protein